MTEKLPHILIFNPDQWRGDALGHAGDPGAVTPVLDRLAAQEGVSFTRAFCQNPVCTPSRCSFMTGWYPHVRGHRTMFHMLRPDEPMLLRRLRQKGYFVWWGGKNDVVPAQNGYDDYCDVKYAPPRPERLMPNPHRLTAWRGAPDGDNYYSFYVGRREIPGGETVAYDSDWAMVEGAIEQIHNAPAGQPLCIYLPLSYPHPPYAVEEPWYSRIDAGRIPERAPTPTSVAGGWEGFPSIMQGLYAGQQMQGWSEERLRELRRTYYGMCARVDHQFGMVLEALRAAGLYDDTLVFFFSDHGDFTGDYGLVEKTQNTFQDCLTRVPFLVKPPAGTPVLPRVSDALVELIDFPATVYALTGIEPGYDHFGRSLLPLIAGETDSHRDAVFCEGGRRRGERQCMELESRGGPEFLYWPRMRLQASEGPEHTKAAMCRTSDHKYVRRLYEQDELYDLREDPKEMRNLVNDPAYGAVLDALRERMLQWYMETADAVPREPDRRS